MKGLVNFVLFFNNHPTIVQTRVGRLLEGVGSVINKGPRVEGIHLLAMSTLFFITLVPRPVQDEIMLFSETFLKFPKNPTKKNLGEN
jgi:hypothetical protein